MNRKLVTLAVVGAFAAPLTAQAQSNVVLYGRVNTSFEWVSGKQADGSDPTINRMSGNSSRLGVKGEEALGGGLKAVYQIESSVTSDAPTGGVLGGRDTFVGLAGGFGQVRIGSFTLPTDRMSTDAGFGWNPATGTGHLATSVFSASGIWGGNANNASTAGGFDNRPGNSIRYDSPRFGGTDVVVQYVTGENSRHANIWDANLISRFGPLQVGIGYLRNSKMRGVDTEDTDFNLSVGYKLGNITIGGVYERSKYESPGGVNVKHDFWGIGGHGNWGVHGVYAFYGTAGDWKGSGSISPTNGGPWTAGSDSGANQFIVVYTYNFSARTRAYVGYHKINNDKNANFTFSINPYAVAKDGDPQVFGIGMSHLF